MSKPIPYRDLPYEHHLVACEIAKALGPVHAWVWTCLYRRSNEWDFELAVPKELLAQDAGIPLRSFQRYVKELMAAGYLAGGRNRNHGGRWDVSGLKVTAPHANLASGGSTTRQLPHVVDGALCSGSGSVSESTLRDQDSEATPEKTLEPNQHQRQRPGKAASIPPVQQRGTTPAVPPPARAVGASGKPKAAKDGMPFPPDFDDWGTGTKHDGTPVNYGWGNVARTYWLQVHDPDAGYDCRDLWGEAADLRYEAMRARDDANRRGEISRAVVAAEHVMEQLKKEGIACDPVARRTAAAFNEE